MAPKIFFFPVTIALLYYTNMVLAATDDPDISLDPTLVQFLLYTRSNMDDGFELITDDDDKTAASQFNSKHPTIIIIHGWKGRASKTWVVNMRKAYLAAGDYNVITLDWHLLAESKYSVAAKLTRSIGAYLGDFLNYLNTQGMSFAQVHIVGHSLGAHIAGIAGSSTSELVSRVTGLDPARPMFSFPTFIDPDNRLDSTDAIFVVVIHTCIKTLGITAAIGHVDFYPNGGSFPQPGCSLLKSQTCSHGRAYDFMTDSIIYPKEFVARECENWDTYKKGDCSDGTIAIMGESVSHESRGKFYLTTKGTSPYGEY